MGDLCASDAVQHSTQAVVRVIAPRDTALGSPTVRVIPRARRWGGQETDLSHLFAGGAAHPGEPQNTKLKADAVVLPRIRWAVMSREAGLESLVQTEFKNRMGC